MTARGTIRQVHQIPGGGWRIALRDEGNRMQDFLWLQTRSQSLAWSCDRFSVTSRRPLVMVTFDPETFPGTLKSVEAI